MDGRRAGRIRAIAIKTGWTIHFASSQPGLHNMHTRKDCRTPRPVEGVDTRALPIGPQEAYVLSRIDGVASEADIVATTGFDATVLGRMLDRLVELGAIRFVVDERDAVPRPQPTSSMSGMHRLSRPVIEASGGGQDGTGHPAAALYDPSELDEQIDIDLPRKRRILDLYYRLDSLTHYELLGIDSKAEKKAIKSAYFEGVTLLHPDRYFGKNLGTFKPKLERVFARVTAAHDILTRKETRAEYDAYLETQQRNRDLDRILTDEQARRRELDRIKKEIEEQARVAERAAAHTPPPRIALDPAARKKLLAMKLGHSGQAARIEPADPPPPDPAAVRERIAAELRERYEERLRAARAQQVRHYVEAAEQALSVNNAVSAANALRIAVSLAPEDATLQKRLDDVQQRAAADLADGFAEQAQYEEREGHYAEAFRSYERAVQGKPSPRLFDRAAFCLLESQGDLRLAGEYARRAVASAPYESHYRVTLARIYLQAGMKSSAQAEFERAAQVSPGDDTIKDWLKRLKRGEA